MYGKQQIKKLYFKIYDLCDNVRYFVFMIKTLLLSKEKLSPEPKVFYFAHAGLGNRLRAHLVALYVASNLAMSVAPFWRRNFHCDADICDVLELDSMSLLDDSCAQSSVEDLTAIVQVKIHGVKESLFLDRSAQFIPYSTLKEICSTHFGGRLAQYVRFNAIVRARAKSMPSGEAAIGMHIRRADFARTIETAALVAAVQGMVAKHGVKLVNLFTQGEPQSLVSVLKGCVEGLQVIVVSSGSNERNAIIDSAELICLAGHRLMILTRGSTFSEFAEVYGDPEDVTYI